VSGALWLFDALLVGALVGVAWRTLASENLLTGVAFFIAFGLLMTLAWVRLAAPDIALAEAGIGAGLSGALFFAALARLKRARAGSRRGDERA